MFLFALTGKQSCFTMLNVYARKMTEYPFDMFGAGGILLNSIHVPISAAAFSANDCRITRIVYEFAH